MVNEYLKYSHSLPYSEIDGIEPLVKKWQELQVQEQLARENLHRAVQKSPEMASLRNLTRSALGCSGSYTLTLNNSHAAVTLSLRAQREEPQHLTYFDPKTLNQLLSSKLLTDEQKKEMLAQHVGGFFKTLDQKGSSDEPIETDAAGDS